jgi:hypothetical protein
MNQSYLSVFTVSGAAAVLAVAAFSPSRNGDLIVRPVPGLGPGLAPVGRGVAFLAAAAAQAVWNIEERNIFTKTTFILIADKGYRKRTNYTAF